MASVRKLNPNDRKSKWIVEYTGKDGKRHRKTPKSGLKKDADTIARKIERELDDNVHTPDRQSATVRRVCDEFYKFSELRYRDGRIGKARLAQIRISIERGVAKHLGSLKFSDLKTTHVEGLYASLLTDGLAPRTARQRVALMSVLSDFAIRRGYVKIDPSIAARKDLRGTKNPKIRTFSTEQVMHVLSVASGPKPCIIGATQRKHDMVKCFTHIAAFCGLRFGEIAGLTLDSVDLTARVIHVRHSVTCFGEFKGPKTAAGIRDVPIPAALCAMLRKWVDDHYLENPLRLMFSTRERREKGQERFYFITQGNFWNRYWRPLLKRAGLAEGDGLHFHALRHFAASWMIQAGIPITEVARMLGHAKFDMTLQVYAHPLLDVARQHETMDRMASALLPAHHVLTLDATQVRL